MHVPVEEIGPIREPNAHARLDRRGRTSLNRRNAPFPSIDMTEAAHEVTGSVTLPTKRSIQRYCSRDDAGSTRT